MKGRKEVLKGMEGEKRRRRQEAERQKEIGRQTQLKRNSSQPDATVNLETFVWKGKGHAILVKIRVVSWMRIRMGGQEDASSCSKL